MPDDEQLHAFIGPPLVDSLRDVCGMGPAQAQATLGAYLSHYGAHGQFDNSVYGGIPELLEALRGAGRTLAVTTSKPEVFATSIVARFDLDRYFSAVVGSEPDGRRSRKSEVLVEALARLGCGTDGARGAAGAVMLGDRSQDVRGATEVGMARIGVLWGYGGPQELIEAGAQGLAATPAEALDLLVEMAGPGPRANPTSQPKDCRRTRRWPRTLAP